MKIRQLSTTYGIELTFVKSAFDTADYATKLDEFKKLTGLNDRMFLDGGVIEIPSPVCNTSEELLSFYTFYRSMGKRLGLQPHLIITENGVTSSIPGGGGHINVGFPLTKVTDKEYCKKFARLMAYEVMTRPYLNWMFNEIIDNLTANSFNGFMLVGENIGTLRTSLTRLFNLSDGENTFSAIRTHIMTPQYVSEYVQSIKTQVPRENRHCIEFRIFDSFKDENELIKCINLVDALVCYVKEKLDYVHVEPSPVDEQLTALIDALIDIPPPAPTSAPYVSYYDSIFNTITSTSVIQAIANKCYKFQSNLDDCIADFGNFYTMLKLPVGGLVEYDSNINNMRKRFELGTSYLT